METDDNHRQRHQQHEAVQARFFAFLMALSLLSVASHFKGGFSSSPFSASSLDEIRDRFGDRDHPSHTRRNLEAVMPSSSARRNLQAVSPSAPSPSNDTLVPSKESQPTTKISPACQPSFNHKTNISRIYFSHTRKAGGTLLRNSLTKIARIMKWELVINEARWQEYPNRTDTLYIVNLREPIKRIISQYQYEGRWICKQMVKNSTLYIPTLENQKTLEQDMDGIMTENRALRENQKMWRCAQECYSQWYNDGYGEYIATLEERYEQAKERLMQYDIIVIAEYLSDPDYVSGLEALFANIDKVKLRKKATIYCSEESYYWNKKMPMGAVNTTTMQQLKDWNVYDTKLYNELTNCGGPQNVIFPNATHQKQYMREGKEFSQIMAKMPGEK